MHPFDSQLRPSPSFMFTPLLASLVAVGCGGGLGLTKYEVVQDTGKGGLNVDGNGGGDGAPDTGWGGGSGGGSGSGGSSGGTTGTGDDSSADGGSGSTGGGSTGGGSTGGGSTGGGSTGGGSTGGGSTGGGSTGGGSSGGGSSGGGGTPSSVRGALNLTLSDFFYTPLCSSSFSTTGTPSSTSCAGCDFVFDMVARPGSDTCGVGALNYSVAVYPGYYGTYDALLYLYAGSWYLNGYAIQSGSTVFYGRYYDTIYLSSSYYGLPYYYSRYGQFSY